MRPVEDELSHSDWTTHKKIKELNKSQIFLSPVAHPLSSLVHRGATVRLAVRAPAPHDALPPAPLLRAPAEMNASRAEKYPLDDNFYKSSRASARLLCGQRVEMSQIIRS